MLIEFSVSNYRSFREKQTFSMVAAPRLGKKGNVFKPNVKGEKVPDLLKVAAIYGSNASGKSNLIKALGIFHTLSRRQSSDPLPFSPFRFDPSLVNEPSRFEFFFIVGGTRYEFELAATSERIMGERLVSYPKGKETLLYKRQYTSVGEEYVFGEMLEGGSVLHDAWRKLTSPKTMFISQAVNNSNEELTQLRIPHKWLDWNTKTIERDMDGLANIALSIGSRFPAIGFEQHISSFLSELDIPVSNIRIEVQDKPDKENESQRTDSTSFNNQANESDKNKKSTKVNATLTHKTALCEAIFDFSEESDGTQNLIGFSLPWMFIGGADQQIQTLVIDELDSSLHPKIVGALIEKLLSFENAAQLIFTTHDTHLMDTKLLRRDQYWLTERDMYGATRLRSIHDFHGRESEDVEKRYYEGRYRGLPILRKS
jgi:AAA15 family ATPase/GTPase